MHQPPCVQEQQKKDSVATPQITVSAQNAYVVYSRNQIQRPNFLPYEQFIINCWIGHLFLLINCRNNYYCLPNVQRNDSNTVSTDDINKPKRCFVLVICDIHSNRPPIVHRFRKSRVSGNHYKHNAITTNPLGLFTPNKTFDYIKQYNSGPQSVTKSETSIDIERVDLASDTQYPESKSSRCFQKLISKLGDAIITDDLSSCGYSVVYPNQTMEEQMSAPISPPKCPDGALSGVELESLDEYKVAFQFAENHGYGFVEFLEVSNPPKWSKRRNKRRKSARTIGDCMYTTSHNALDERFSIKYDSTSKNNNRLSQKGNRFCNKQNAKGSTNSQTQFKNDIDIGEIRQSIVNDISIEDSGENKTCKQDVEFLPKKFKSGENWYRKIINEQYGRPANRHGFGDVGETLEGRCEDSIGQGRHEIAGDQGQSVSGDVIRNDNEYSKVSPVPSDTDAVASASNIKSLEDIDTKNMPHTDVHSQEKSNMHDISQTKVDCDVQKSEDFSETGGSDDDEAIVVNISKPIQTPFWERIKKLNPFRSLGSTINVFKKRNNPHPCEDREPPSLKLETVRINSVQYNVIERTEGITNDVTQVSNQNERKETETCLSPNREVVRPRPQDEPNRRSSSNALRCRPKPRNLKNSKVTRLLQACAGGRRFSSSTNVTKDSKEIKSTSLERFMDATAGDFKQRHFGDFDKLQLSSSASKANPYGDVLALWDVNKGIELPSHQELERVLGPSNVTPEFDGEQLNTAAPKELVEMSENNNNKCEPTDPSVNAVLCNGNIYYEGRDESGENITATTGNVSEGKKIDDADQDTSLPNANFNCNNNNNNNNIDNANDTETPYEPEDDEDQNQLNSKVDHFQNEPTLDSSSSVGFELRGGNDDGCDSALENTQASNVVEYTVGDHNVSVDSADSCHLSTCDNDHNGNGNTNSSKNMQEDDDEPRAQLRIQPTAILETSYLVSPPGGSEFQVPIIYNNTGETDQTSSCNNGDEERSLSRDDISLETEESFPAINMHQRNMVFCPTTENYWAQSNPSHLTLLGNQHESTARRLTTDQPMSLEQRCDNLSCSEANCDSMDLYRHVDACIAESEHKLSQRLENLYVTVNDRLSCLENLVSNKIDKTLNLIEGLKIQSGHESVIKTKKGRKNASRAKQNLDVETTTSTMPNTQYVKNRKSHSYDDRSSSDDTLKMAKTYDPQEAADTSNSHTQSRTSEREDDIGGHTANRSEEPHPPTRKQNVKQLTKHKTRRSTPSVRNKKKPSKQSKSKLTRSKKPKKAKQNQRKSKNRAQALIQTCLRRRIQNGDPYYSQNEHSRQCRVRHKMIGGNCCTCMMTAKTQIPGVKDYIRNMIKPKDVVLCVTDENCAVGNFQECRRPSDPLVMRLSQNRTKRNGSSKAGNCKPKRRQRTKSNKSKASVKPVKSKQFINRSKRNTSNVKRVGSWSRRPMSKAGVARKLYRRCPNSTVVKHSRRVIRGKGTQKIKESLLKEAERNAIDITTNSLRNYLDHCNLSAKNTTGRPSVDREGMAPTSSTTQNDALDQSETGDKDFDSEIKNEAIERFGRLISTCSQQRAHDLHRILSLGENTSNTPCHTESGYLDKSTQFDEHPLNENEEINKWLGGTVMDDSFNNSHRSISETLIHSSQSMIRRDDFDDVESCRLIKNSHRCQDETSLNPLDGSGTSLGSCQTFRGVAFEPSTSSNSTRRASSSTEIATMRSHAKTYPSPSMQTKIHSKMARWQHLREANLRVLKIENKSKRHVNVAPLPTTTVASPSSDADSESSL